MEIPAILSDTKALDEHYTDSAKLVMTFRAGEQRGRSVIAVEPTAH